MNKKTAAKASDKTAKPGTSGRKVKLRDLASESKKVQGGQRTGSAIPLVGN
jgi:hypothetical protein